MINLATKMLFGTVGSPITTPKKPGGSIGAIQQLRVLGLDALELGWVQSVRVSKETCLRIKDTSASENIQLSVHAPYFINLNASNEEWPKSRKRLMDAAVYGFLAGASDVVFHPGSYFGVPFISIRKFIVSRLQNCISELNQNHINIILRPETMGKKSLIGSLEDVLYLCSTIPDVLPCMDFAHLHARNGDGSLNTVKEWERVLTNYQKELGVDSLNKLHIHLSGIEFSEKGERKHLSINESDLNVRAIFDVLQSFNCCGRILCESPIMESDAILLRDMWME